MNKRVYQGRWVVSSAEKMQYDKQGNHKLSVGQEGACLATGSRGSAAQDATRYSGVVGIVDSLTIRALSARTGIALALTFTTVISGYIKTQHIKATVLKKNTSQSDNARG
ncbi:hypothetical protein IWW45_006924 [Coemansia sp. RSA 485]|nr:hypothetical protein IWW45_006924 [Coemansia sp. RSA 485]